MYTVYSREHVYRVRLVGTMLDMYFLVSLYITVGVKYSFIPLHHVCFRDYSTTFVARSVKFMYIVQFHVQ